MGRNDRETSRLNQPLDLGPIDLLGVTGMHPVETRLITGKPMPFSIPVDPGVARKLIIQTTKIRLTPDTKKREITVHPNLEE